MEDYRKYLDPKTLNKVAGLDLKARLIVEGFVSGRHRSPYKGSSVEFREHREYSPGDDVRFIDWKVYGKSDRYYIKEYEEETNLKAYVVVDTSKSMDYSSNGISKLEYAKYVAAAIAHLVSRQQDAVALVLWDKELKKFLPPGNNPLHLKDVYRSLSEAKADGATDMARLMAELAERVRQKSLIIVLSDLLDTDRVRLLRALKQIRFKGHDVIMFHVLDDAEITFPFERMTLFEGLEVDERLLADPKALKEAYLAEFGEFIHQIKSACIANRMDYVTLNTSAPLDVALSSYLAAREDSR